MTSSQIRAGKSSNQYRKRGISKSPLLTIPVGAASMLSEVARNSNGPVAMPSKLRGYKERRMLDTMASNPNTPVNVLTKLSRDEDHSVRHQVAQNPNLPQNAKAMIILSE